MDKRLLVVHNKLKSHFVLYNFIDNTYLVINYGHEVACSYIFSTEILLVSRTSLGVASPRAYRRKCVGETKAV